MIRPRWLTQIAATWDKSHAAIAAGTKSRPYVGFLFRCYSDPYKDKLSDDETADLVAYLLSLKGH